MPLLGLLQSFTGQGGPCHAGVQYGVAIIFQPLLQKTNVRGTTDAIGPFQQRHRDDHLRGTLGGARCIRRRDRQLDLSHGSFRAGERRTVDDRGPAVRTGSCGGDRP